jgi:hypothetical protein
MFSKIIGLEWKSFLRSSSVKKGITMKILIAFLALYFIVCFSFLGASSYFLVAKTVPNIDPLQTICNFMVLWFVFDLLFRFFMQKLPVLDIKTFMVLPIKKHTIVHYLLLKSGFSLFNIFPLFFFLPFSLVLLFKGYAALNVFAWLLSMLLLVLLNNFVNFMINRSNVYFYSILGVLITCVALHRFDFLDVVTPIGAFYFGMYKQPLLFLFPVVLLVVFYKINFQHFLNKFYLDDAVFAKKQKTVPSTEFTWLNKFGDVAPFLKNDIKLIWRNKRPKSLLTMSSLMLFYGLVFFTNPIYEGSMQFFAAIFITGIFLINFGQLIPAWDSAYFNLLMSQNISMYQYLNSKRILLLFSVVLLTLLSLPYFYFGWQIGVLLIVGGVYNAGLNLPILLLVCAYNKKRIDLSKGAMMNYEGMGVAQWLLILPLAGMPIIVFLLINYVANFNTAVLILFVLGLAGLFFQKYFMSKIVVLFKKRKYATIIGFQQK